MLRKVDPVLWARVLARSEADGIHLKSVFLQLLALYASGQITLTKGPDHA